MGALVENYCSRVTCSGLHLISVMLTNYTVMLTNYTVPQFVHLCNRVNNRPNLYRNVEKVIGQ